MTRNREIEIMLRGVLERSIRLVYLAASRSKEVPRDIETLLKPIVEAIRKGDPDAAQDTVIADIARGQLNALGSDVWNTASNFGSRPAHAALGALKHAEAPYVPS